MTVRIGCLKYQLAENFEHEEDVRYCQLTRNWHQLLFI